MPELIVLARNSGVKQWFEKRSFNGLFDEKIQT